MKKNNEIITNDIDKFPEFENIRNAILEAREKVFDAVFQFHHALLCRLSGFGFHCNFVFQFCKGTNLIIALCGNL